MLALSLHRISCIFFLRHFRLLAVERNDLLITTWLSTVTQSNSLQSCGEPYVTVTRNRYILFEVNCNEYRLASKKYTVYPLNILFLNCCYSKRKYAGQLAGNIGKEERRKERTEIENYNYFSFYDRKAWIQCEKV